MTLTYRVGGWSLCQRMLPAWSLLWLIVPVPLELDGTFIRALQSWTSEAASAVLDRLGVFHSLAGNVIRVDGQQLLVEEACSGAHSFFALMPLTLFYVLWKRRPWFFGALLMVAAAGWVVVANVGRVVATTYLTTQLQVDVVTGWPHHVLGLAVSALAVCGILSTEQLLMWFRYMVSVTAVLTPPELEDVDTEEEIGPPTDSMPVLPPRLGGYAASMYGFLAVGQLVLLGPQLIQDAHHWGSEPLMIERLGDDYFAQTPPSWQQVDYRIEDRGVSRDMARYSQTWRYYAGVHKVLLSVDYPYVGVHDLTPCYRNQGWRLVKKEHRGENAGAAPCIVAEFVEPLGAHGFLVYQGFDPGGAPLATRRVMRPSDSFVERSMSRIKTNWWSRFNAAPSDLPGYRPPSYQVQLFVASNDPLTGKERSEALGFYQQAVERISSRAPGAAGSER